MLCLVLRKSVVRGCILINSNLTKLFPASKHIIEVAAFALPISASMLVNMVISFAVTIMTAQLGKDFLAAGALAMPTFITIMTLIATIFYALGILISHQKGNDASAPFKIGELVKSGFWLALVLAIPANILFLNADKLLILMKEDPHLVALLHGYFQFAGLTMIPTLIGAVIFQFFAGIGKPRLMFLVSLFSMPAAIVLSYGLILGRFGFPPLGLTGITCATFIVQSMVCFCLIIFMLLHKEMQKYAIFSKKFLPKWALFKAIFVLGFPIGIQFGAEVAAMAMATYLMGHFGTMALASRQIVLQYSLLVVMLVLGLSQAVSMLTSKAFANRDNELIKQYILSGMVILVFLFIAVFLLFVIFPHWLMSFFINIADPRNASMVHLTIQLFIVSAILVLIDGARNVLSGALRGLHDSKAPMKIGVLCLWLISLPVCYWAGFILHGGPVGLSAGFLSGFLLAVVLLGLRIYRVLQDKAGPFRNF